MRGQARPNGRFDLIAVAATVRAVLEKHWLTSDAAMVRFGLTQSRWRRVRDYLHATCRRNEDGDLEWSCADDLEESTGRS